MGSFWWWSLDDYRLIIKLSFNRHPMIIAETCVISWLNRRPIVGSWRSGWRLSGNPGSPANPGNLWKPCFRTSETPHKSSTPVLILTSINIWSCVKGSRVVQLQTSASAIIVWERLVCGTTLTNRMTNAHPGSRPKSFTPRQGSWLQNVNLEMFHRSWSQIVESTYFHNCVCLFKNQKQTIKYKTWKI